ncbi:MAG: serine/threonine-protein kinase, partial [Acidobacteria bacterium]|nr:serine/threonine-protein kinase [Acidobacteriota bacterium]
AFTRNVACPDRCVFRIILHWTTLMEDVAIKILNDSGTPPRFKREIGVGEIFHGKQPDPRRRDLWCVCAASKNGELKDGRKFLVMEFASGGAVDDLYAEQRQLTDHDVVRFAVCGAVALYAINARQIVHRDFKCGNILIHKDQRFLLADFGEALCPDVERFTTDNSFVGTKVYNSPEQIDTPSSVDGRADIWSYGVVLYRMLAGDLPFKGHVGPLVNAIRRNAHTPVLHARPDAPPLLAAIVERCLQKAPADRYQSPAEILRALGTLPVDLVDDVARAILAGWSLGHTVGSASEAPSQSTAAARRPSSQGDNAQSPRPEGMQRATTIVAEPGMVDLDSIQDLGKDDLLFFDDTVLRRLVSEPEGEVQARELREVKLVWAGATRGGRRKPISSSAGVRVLFEGIVKRLYEAHQREELSKPSSKRTPGWDRAWTSLPEKAKIHFLRASKSRLRKPLATFLEPLKIQHCAGAHLRGVVTQMADADGVSVEGALTAAEAIASGAKTLYTLRRELTEPDVAKYVTESSQGYTDIEYLGEDWQQGAGAPES